MARRSFDVRHQTGFTTIAMIAGMLPVAFGYGEINKVRAGMGVATIGGLISSTLLSLVVIPCVYIYLDRFRVKSQALIRKYYFGESDIPAVNVAAEDG